MTTSHRSPLVPSGGPDRVTILITSPEAIPADDDAVIQVTLRGAGGTPSELERIVDNP